jgi:hypothetical protein
MYEDGVPPALPVNFGFNHQAEVGRPFRGSGENMFDETSRCWKCRFIHHYEVGWMEAYLTEGMRLEER